MMVAIANPGVIPKLKQDRTSWDRNNDSRDESRVVQDILDWISDVPLSKTIKNLPRDFSDAGKKISASF